MGARASRIRTRLIAVVAAAIVSIGTLSAVQPAGAAITGGTTPWPGGTWEPDPERYGTTVDQNVAVTMSDGATLYANVGYPTDPATGARAAGKFPVLLTQNSYPGPGANPKPFFVNRGYIHAVVQLRGTQDTTGPGGQPVANDQFSPRHAEDGVELVDWAAKLPGSTGTIGLYGCSQLGVIQIFTAAAVGPDSPVKAIVPACSYYAYDNQFAGGMPSQLLNLIQVVPSAAVYGPKNGAVTDANNKALLAEVLASGPRAYNGEHWQERSTLNAMPQIAKNKIPTLLWSGWTPADGPGSLYEYAALQNAAAGRPPFGPMSPNQKTSGKYQVVIGPWSHGQGLDDSIQLEWYDTWLKGQDTGIADTKTPMHLFELPSSRWVNVSSFPITDAATPMYLGDGGVLTSSVPKSSGNADIQWGAADAPGTSLAFLSDPVDAQQVIAGPVAATIYAKSSTRNLQMSATLADVAPEGTATDLVTGNIVGSLRGLDKKNSWYDKRGRVVHPVPTYRADDFAKPDTVNRYDIALTPTVYSVAPGHRLRLTLSTIPPSSKCGLSVSSALGLPAPCLPTNAQRTDLTGSTYSIEWGKSTPSAVNIPLVAPEDMPTAASGVTPTSNNRVEPLDWSS